MALKFIRIFDPIHIPEYLVDQIKDKDFTTEAFYKYQASICTQEDNGQLVINPYNLLFVLVDEDKKVQGFIWAVVDILNVCLCINNYSIDRKYWGKGRAIELLKDWALEIKNGAKLKNIYWITRATKYCEKFGFSKSKNVLYEYIEENKEQEDGKSANGHPLQDKGELRSIHTGTAGPSKSNSGRNGGTSEAVV